MISFLCPVCSLRLMDIDPNLIITFQPAGSTDMEIKCNRCKRIVRIAIQHKTDCTENDA